MSHSSNVLAQSSSPVTGVGLFSGATGAVTVHPGPGSIQLARVESGRTIARVGARIEWVTGDTAWTGLPPGVPVRNTTLDATVRPESGRFVVATVEHLLASLAGLGVWDAQVQLHDGPEVPVLDGSALPFVEALLPVLETSEQGPDPVVLSERVEVVRGDAFIRAEPSPPEEPIAYTYSLDYGPGAAITPQAAVWRGSAGEFARAIAPARTFSLRAEAEAARRAGLFSHLTPRDMLVIDDQGRPIDNEWRLPEEPARHKLLDLIGDLALLGGPFHANVLAHKAGHALAHEFCRKVHAMQERAR
ncbi:UDP-3-O-[3-hydroxymyristoyl] N-acetylglucosamine deacetylase [Phycisphaerales bacterium]|nr:UDP-3-O-[3-hydroxymyristoyl] N-acetylglucosamine deacetylase [Phycisphaerales bacterium]